MGLEQAIIVSSLIKAGTSIFAGNEARKAGKVSQAQFKEQARIILAEAKRDAGNLRLKHKIDLARLKLQFLHQGVAIQGSAERIVESSEHQQNKETQAIIDSGVARSQFMLLQGKNAASAGRAQLIGSIASGASDVLSSLSRLDSFDTETGLNLSTPSAARISSVATIQPAGTFDAVGGLESIATTFVGV